MSHITIVISGKRSTASATEDSGTIDASATYAVPHGTTPEQIGTEVAKLAKKVGKMVDGTPED